jgi:hypothetical protein
MTTIKNTVYGIAQRQQIAADKQQGGQAYCTPMGTQAAAALTAYANADQKISRAERSAVLNLFRDGFTFNASGLQQLKSTFKLSDAQIAKASAGTETSVIGGNPVSIGIPFKPMKAGESFSGNAGGSFVSVSYDGKNYWSTDLSRTRSLIDGTQAAALWALAGYPASK